MAQLVEFLLLNHECLDTIDIVQRRGDNSQVVYHKHSSNDRIVIASIKAGCNGGQGYFTHNPNIHRIAV